LRTKSFSTLRDNQSPFCQYLDFSATFFDNWYNSLIAASQSN
jgi:hypothetical protein